MNVHDAVTAETDEREPLLDGLRAAHGRRDVAIWIEAVDVRRVSDDTVLATYEEWQQAPEDQAPRARLSTALVRRADLSWLHVHETWLDG